MSTGRRIGDRIRERRKELGITAEQVAEALGLSPATIYRYERGDIEKVPGSILEPLAAVLMTTPKALMGWEPPPIFAVAAEPEASERALHIAKLYDLASAREKEIIDLMLKPYEEKLASAAPETGKVVAFPKKKKPRKDGFEDLDVYDQPAAAGLGNYLDVPVSRQEQYPAGYIPKGTSFGVLISGESMQPRIANGATAFVQATPAVDNGEVGVFVLNGQSYCKMLVIDRERREVRLRSVNPRYDDIVVGEGDELRTIGRVLGSYPLYGEDEET